MTGDWRDERIAELEERNRALELQLVAMAERLAKLEEQLRQSSQNSSKPPSSDPPWLLRGSKKPRSGKKPGGQPGHKKSERALLPPERVDETHDHWPERCENCHHAFGGVLMEVGEAQRHQVVELPRVMAHVTEHRLHSRQCARCEWTTQASLPEGVAPGCFGPRLVAVVALCAGLYRLSKRTTLALLSDLFGVEMALGSVSACEQKTSAALAAPVEEARKYVEAQPVAYADETSWREARGRAWIWVAVTTAVTVFLVHARRNTAAARQLLGRFAGVLVSDRWRAYDSWKLRSRQLCWAHLKRYFKAFSELRGAPRPIGTKLLALTKQMFVWWHRVRDGTLTRTTFQAYMRPVTAQVERLLDEGCTCGHSKVEGTCKDILELADAMWTFVRVPGVEPTNNAAERALRFCVLMRKTSFGTHSAAGSRFIERMLTVSATLRQQGRNVVEYVTEAVEGALTAQPAPSLLPGQHFTHTLSNAA